MVRAPTLVLLCVLVALSLACNEGSHTTSDVADAGSSAPTAKEREPVQDVPAFVGPPAPPKRIFARRFVVKVREAPKKGAPRIGYLRGGAVHRATTGHPVGFDGCRKGWYELDTGGFVCATFGVTPFLGRRLPERRALQPDLSAKLPYPYGYSRRANTPVYRRLPTDEEAALYEGYQIPGLEDAGVAEAPGTAEVANTVAPQGATSHVPTAQAVEGEEGEEEPGVPTLDSLLGESDSVLMRRMERGFYVSLDREMRKGARHYYRTQSNGFIPKRGLRLVEGSDFHGVELAAPGARALMPVGAGDADAGVDPAAMRLPLAFVMSSKATAYKVNPRGRLVPGGRPGYHHAFAIVDDTTVRGKSYLVGADGRHYRPEDVRRIDLRTPPEGVGPDEKWIDVNLSKQTLVLYVGPQPVYATLISSGRIKDEDDPLKNFETPTGAFRLTSKHLTATMDGDHAIYGPYSIEDVPYVMYFELAFALHSAFWHDSFGRPRSHGCINLAPRDARHVFNWATPEVPKGWHGAYPDPEGKGDRLGTRLYIHGETPQG